MTRDFPPPPYTVESVMGETLTDICLGYDIAGAGSPIIVASVYGDDDVGPGDMTHQQAERLAKFLAHAANCHEELVAALRSLVAEVDRNQYRKPSDGDWACRECKPHSDMLQDGFRCGYHTAKALLAALAPSTALTKATQGKDG